MEGNDCRFPMNNPKPPAFGSIKAMHTGSHGVPSSLGGKDVRKGRVVAGRKPRARAPSLVPPGADKGRTEAGREEHFRLICSTVGVNVLGPHALSYCRMLPLGQLVDRIGLYDFP